MLLIQLYKEVIKQNIIRIITSKGKIKPLPFVIGPMGNVDSNEFTSKTF